MKKPSKSFTEFVVDRWINPAHFDQHTQSQPSGCILWQGIRTRVGYGMTGFKYATGITSTAGRAHGMMTVHRLAWMRHHQRLPTQPNINHSCHEKLCVNPQHLVEGTQQQKLQDMRSAGVWRSYGGGARGSYNHQQYGRKYKYSIDQIQWMRSADLEQIQHQFGCTRIQAQRKRWGFRNGYAWLPPLDPQG